MEDILHDRWPRIVAKGVCLDRYEPLAEFPDLYERFARIKSQADAVKFIRTFGPLTEEGLPKGRGESLELVMDNAENMAKGHLHVGLVPVADLKARLVPDGGALALIVEPTDLREALWLQFAQAASRGHANRCRQCGSLFATGPDAGRRKGAEFCSVECKTRWHSLKRSR
jgi:hypothetical protein